MLSGGFCSMLTCIKLQYGVKTFVFSIFEWPLKTGFSEFQVCLLLIFSFVCLVSKQVASVSGLSYSGSSGSCLDALDTELRRMIQQVRDVLPQVPVSAVKNDLGKRKKSGGWCVCVCGGGGVEL